MSLLPISNSKDSFRLEQIFDFEQMFRLRTMILTIIKIVTHLRSVNLFLEFLISPLGMSEVSSEYYEFKVFLGPLKSSHGQLE